MLISPEIAWIKAARKTFSKFPKEAQIQIRAALTIAAEGRKADIAKSMKGLGPGVFEIALRHAGNAYRTVYVAEIGDTLWVIHAFQKKSPSGIKTAKKDIDVIRERLKRLKTDLS